MAWRNRHGEPLLARYKMCSAGLAIFCAQACFRFHMLRFTIREILLCTLISALVLGWWLDHRQLTRQCAARHQALIQNMMSACQNLAKQKGEDVYLDAPGISMTAKVNGSTNVTLGNPPR